MGTRKSERHDLLAKLIEARTVLREGEHFRFIRPIYSTKKRKNPDDYVIVHFTKCNLSVEEMKKMLVEGLNDLGIEPQDEIKRFYLKLPNTGQRLINILESKSSMNDLAEARKFDFYKRCLTLLSKVHEKVRIFGLRNKDQKDLQQGLANFNYFDKEECRCALKYFENLGLKVKKRTGKSCNLSFDLKGFNPESLEEPPSFTTRALDMKACLWLIAKSGKRPFNISNNRFDLSCAEMEAIETERKLLKYGLKVSHARIKVRLYRFTVELTLPAVVLPKTKRKYVRKPVPEKPVKPARKKESAPKGSAPKKETPQKKESAKRSYRPRNPEKLYTIRLEDAEYNLIYQRLEEERSILEKLLSRFKK